MDSQLGLQQATGALARLGCLYAQAMDRNEPDLLQPIICEDIVIEGPGFCSTGLAEVSALPGMLNTMYLRTQHVIHNQTFTVNGDDAKGETYCTANHILPAQGSSGHQALVWAVRYQDSYRQQDGVWRFSRRELILDWSETRPVQFAE